MRDADVLGPGDGFDRREMSGAPLDNIIAQYERNTNVKVIIMDGGGIDLFNGGTQSQIDAIVNGFKAFLQQVADDGNVEHIIYSLYPDIPGVPGELNTIMKPGFMDACENGPVDCHLIDLEPIFQGQHYGGDTIHPDETGSELIGGAWWKVMQDNCIAQ